MQQKSATDITVTSPVKLKPTSQGSRLNLTVGKYPNQQTVSGL